MTIQDFHKYNRLVRRGVADPLCCPHCEFPYVLRATREGDPLLQCLMCQSMVQPGLKMWDKVRAVNKEWYA